MLQTKAELIIAKTNDLLTGAAQHYLGSKVKNLYGTFNI